MLEQTIWKQKDFDALEAGTRFLYPITNFQTRVAKKILSGSGHDIYFVGTENFHLRSDKAFARNIVITCECMTFCNLCGNIVAANVEECPCCDPTPDSVFDDLTERFSNLRPHHLEAMANALTDATQQEILLTSAIKYMFKAMHALEASGFAADKEKEGGK